MALPILDGNQTAATLSTIITGGAHIPAHTVVSLGSQAIADISSAVSGISVSIGGTQTTTFGAVTGSVSVLNFPSTQTIAGTVTANVFSDSFTNLEGVIAGNDGSGQEPYLGVQLGFYDPVSQAYNTVKQSNPLPISGTVTVGGLPSGALTTRFGSVTTANTAQITSAVTNANRKYLLAQNISAGTVTIGIGFSPTTTQGIQLAAGAGLTFDAFCPTGAIYWLGAVTGAALTILEG